MNPSCTLSYPVEFARNHDGKEVQVDLSDQERKVLATVRTAADVHDGPLDLPYATVARWIGQPATRDGARNAFATLCRLISAGYLRAEIDWDRLRNVSMGRPIDPISTVSVSYDARGTKVTTERVFVVHGHDLQLRDNVARFIERLGFEAIILAERPSGGRTLIEQVERYADVRYAIVLLTPDDIQGQNGSDSADPAGRARQNVIFELGFFVGRLGRSRVHCLRKGKLELFSDFDGVISTPVDAPGVDWRFRVAREMTEVGLSVDFGKIA
jgi:predicted nucleotide-binding protein